MDRRPHMQLSALPQTSPPQTSPFRVSPGPPRPAALLHFFNGQERCPVLRRRVAPGSSPHASSSDLVPRKPAPAAANPPPLPPRTATGLCDWLELMAQSQSPLLPDAGSRRYQMTRIPEPTSSQVRTKQTENNKMKLAGTDLHLSAITDRHWPQLFLQLP